MNVDLIPRYKIQNAKVWTLIGKGNKTVYFTLVNTNSIPAGVKKWNSTFQDLNWLKIFQKCFLTTSDNQLRWFQLRVLHRLLPTARYLFLKNIVDSPVCCFCENEEETIQHLLWQCEIVTIFWNDLKHILTIKCAHLVDFSFHEDLVIFGCHEQFMTDQVLDLIILLGKFFIYKCRFVNVLPSITGFKVLLKSRFQIEELLSKRKNQHKTFMDNWLVYKTFIFE